MKDLRVSRMHVSNGNIEEEAVANVDERFVDNTYQVRR